MRQKAIFPSQAGDYQMTKMNAHGFIDMPPVISRVPVTRSDETAGLSGQIPDIYTRAHFNSSVRARRGDAEPMRMI